tara:strand:- start:2853 stop:3434 length:582 start_codon:yes stop_codon:yes gene_type:complete
MATTIQNFFAKAQEAEFSRDFLFRVNNIKLTGPTAGSSIEFGGDQELIYARSATLPGRAIENKVVSYMGLDFNLPGRATYTNSAGYSVEFYADADNSLRGKFEAASRAVFDDQFSTGQYGMPGVEDVITLDLLDKGLNTTKQLKLIGASIRDIGDLSYSISDGTGEVVSFPVSFAYHYYENTLTGAGNPFGGQ